MTILYILLAIIAFMLWRIYRQKEEEKEEKFNAEWEAQKKEKFKDYPHLIGNVSYTWLEVFGKMYVEKNLPHLKAAFLIYLKESNNSQLDMEVDMLLSSVWDLTEELLEHLEQYHESTQYEYEIAVLTYWQIIGEAAGSFVGKDIEDIRAALRSAPFTDIQKITSWFPKKPNHPDKELSFTDEKGVFPRESNGSNLIREKVKALGI